MNLDYLKERYISGEEISLNTKNTGMLKGIFVGVFGDSLVVECGDDELSLSADDIVSVSRRKKQETVAKPIVPFPSTNLAVPGDCRTPSPQNQPSMQQASNPPSHAVSQEKELGLDRPEPSQSNHDGSSSAVPLSNGNEQVRTASVTDTQRELYKAPFIGEPQLSMPEPIFETKLQTDNYQAETELRNSITRLKNIYDNAKRVHEMGRLVNHIHDISTLAQKYNDHGYFFYLHAMFLYHGGQAGETRQLLDSAVSHDYPKANLAYAAALISEKAFAEAIPLLIQHICEEDHTVDATLIRTLGQCIITSNDLTQCSRIGHILSPASKDSAAWTLAKNLVAYLVWDDENARKAALKGDVELLRQTRIGNNLFDWDDEEKESIAGVPIIVRRETPGEENRRGRITAYYANRCFGFLMETQTGLTWFFRLFEADTALKNSLLNRKVRQEVSFSGDPNDISSYAKYPQATQLQLLAEELQSESTEKAPLSVRLYGLPNDGTFYARAKRAEQLDSLDEAEKLFRLEILDGPSSTHLKSAIKDLAMLLNRQDRSLEAVELLKVNAKHFQDIQERRSLQQMKVQFFAKAKRFTDAIQLLKQIIKGEENQDRKRSYEQQVAYFYYANGEPQKAITAITSLAKKYPHLPEIAMLQAKIESAIPVEEKDTEADILELLAEENQTYLAKLRLEECKYEGLPVQQSSAGIFSETDIQKLSGLITRTGRQRPFDRSRYHLTLAKVCSNMEKPIPEINRHLFKYFEAQTEGCALDSSKPIECIRCNALEALHFAATVDEKEIAIVWGIFLATFYLVDRNDYSKIISNLWDTRAGDSAILSGLKELSKNAPQLEAFWSDEKVYQRHAPEAFARLKSCWDLFQGIHHFALGSGPSLYEKVSRQFAHFRGLVLSAGRLSEIRNGFLDVKFDGEQKDSLDHERIKSLCIILEQAADYVSSISFSGKQNLYLEITHGLEELSDECSRRPTFISAELLQPHLSHIAEMIENDFERLKQEEPEFRLDNLLGQDILRENGQVELHLAVSLCKELAPVPDYIRIFAKDRQECEFFTQGPLSTLRLDFIVEYAPTPEEQKSGTFQLEFEIEYATRFQDAKQAGPFPVTVHLGHPLEKDIPNPYEEYAGGSWVDKDDMFFGRRELIQRIVKYVSVPYSGQCFVLYGQKRSGKTSVLRHIEKSLPEKTIYSYISAQSFGDNPERLSESFVQELYNALTMEIEERQIVLDGFPTINGLSELSASIAIQRISRAMKNAGYAWILAIDEFTSLYSEDERDVARFMHLWKSMLENKLFNAVIIGQDTMPRFKEAYPNDFCVTNDERISFLDRTSAEQLATKPILAENDQSRYVAGAFDTLFRLTAGSPYFMQKMCSKVVTYMNTKRFPAVTSADVESVAETMIRGGDRVGKEVFDALVTSGDRLVAEFGEESLWKVLTTIAEQSSRSGWCSLADIPEEEKALLEDLRKRGTLEEEEGKVRICVDLFAKWLRVNGGR